jgi:hypothetical protein
MPSKKSANQPIKHESAQAQSQAVTSLFSFEQAYPVIAEWIMELGLIEVCDQDDFSGSFIRALDPGGDDQRITWHACCSSGISAEGKKT